VCVCFYAWIWGLRCASACWTIIGATHTEHLFNPHSATISSNQWTRFDSYERRCTTRYIINSGRQEYYPTSIQRWCEQQYYVFIWLQVNIVTTHHTLNPKSGHGSSHKMPSAWYLLFHRTVLMFYTTKLVLFIFIRNRLYKASWDPIIILNP
jgi:hypothetical protein